MIEWEPRIVGFCCSYCASAAVDVAASMRLQYPPSVRLIEMPCSGKIDQLLVLEAFEDGADGVFVAGCMEGDCHFLKGNIRAKRRTRALKRLLDEIGVGGERLEMFNLSAAMGPRFAEIVRQMTLRVQELGPSPLVGQRVQVGDGIDRC
jgi:F420-non-reducing hydrogenase iron-sulfur subunit